MCCDALLSTATPRLQFGSVKSLPPRNVISEGSTCGGTDYVHGSTDVGSDWREGTDLMRGSIGVELDWREGTDHGHGSIGVELDWRDRSRAWIYRRRVGLAGGDRSRDGSTGVVSDWREGTDHGHRSIGVGLDWRGGSPFPFY